MKTLTTYRSDETKTAWRMETDVLSSFLLESLVQREAIEVNTLEVNSGMKVGGETRLAINMR